MFINDEFRKMFAKVTAYAEFFCSLVLALMVGVSAFILIQNLRYVCSRLYVNITSNVTHGGGSMPQTSREKKKSNYKRQRWLDTCRRLYCCSVFHVFVFLMLGIWFAVAAVSFKSAIYTAMKNYRTSGSHKTGIDNLQITQKCCGNEAYSDWFTVQWSNKPNAYYVDVDKSNRQIISADVPFSCCDVGSMRPCVNKYVERENVPMHYNPVTGKTIYVDGCYYKLQLTYHLLPSIAAIASFVNFLIKILIGLIRRLLYLSLKLASLKGQNLFIALEVDLNLFFTSTEEEGVKDAVAGEDSEEEEGELQAGESDKPHVGGEHVISSEEAAFSSTGDKDDKAQDPDAAKTWNW